MAINLDVNATSVFEARNAVRSLEEEYARLNQQITNLNNLEQANGRLTIEQQRSMEQLRNSMSELNREMNGYYNTIDQLDEFNLTATFEDIYGAVLPLSSQIGELEDRLYQMALMGEQGTEEFIALTERIATMKSTIRDVDTEIDILTANKGINGLKEQFGNLGTSLLNLNFENATRSLEGMKTAMKGIDADKMANDMIKFGKNIGGTLVQAVKSATQVFSSFGKVLLANPIFLIAAIIVGVGVALYALKDKVKIIQVYFEMLGEAIGWLTGLFDKAMDALNDFTDWLGLTNVAEEKLAVERAARAKEEEDRIDNETKLKNAALNNELAILNAKGVNTEEEIKQSAKLKEEIIRNEIAKLEAKQKTIQADIAAIRVKGKLTTEEREQITKLKEAYEDLTIAKNKANTDIQVNEIQTQNQLDKLRDDGNKKAEDAQKKAADKRKAAADKAEQERKKLVEEANKFIEKINEYHYAHLYDNEAKAYDKEYKLTIDALERERKEILKNTQLTGEQRTTIEQYYTDLKTEAEKKRSKAIEEENKKVNDNIKSYEDKLESEQFNNKQKYLKEQLDLLKKNGQDTIDLANEIENNRYNNEVKNLQKEREELLKNKDLNEKEIESINNYYNEKEKEAKREHTNELNKITEESFEYQKQKRQEEFDATINGVRNGLASVASEYNAGFAVIGNSLLDGISNIQGMLSEMEEITVENAAALASSALSMVSGVLSGISQQLNIELESNLAKLNSSTDESMRKLDDSLNAGLISQEEYGKQKYQLELAQYNKEEAMKKKAFEQDKKLKIAQASIAMVQGMVSAFTGAMQLGPIVGPIVGGVLAAAVGTMGAINIAKIKSTKYESGTAPSAPEVPSISTPNMEDGRSNKLYDTGMSSNTSQGSTSSSNSSNNSETIVIESKVSVVELESTSNKVKQYANNGEL